MRCCRGWVGFVDALLIQFGLSSVLLVSSSQLKPADPPSRSGPYRDLEVEEYSTPFQEHTVHLGANRGWGGRDSQGRTRLHRAVQGRSRELVEQLLAEGADVNAGDCTGSRPLHCAASGAFADAVGLLVGSGANVGAKDHNGWTPLHIAAVTKSEGSDNLRTMDNLLKAGLEPCASDLLGNTPLHLVLIHAISADWVQLCLVEKLLDYGADVNLRNAAGMTPFHIALDHLGPQIPLVLITMFLHHGADVGLKDRKGTPPFQAFLERCKSFRYGHPFLKEEINSVVKTFLAYGANPDAKSQTGDSLLCWLLRCGDCLRGNLELVLLLCERANVNFRGTGGNYPLHEVTTCSIKHGPNCVNVLQCLLNRGADPNAVNDSEVSPLLALFSGKGKRLETLEMTKALLENGADPMLRDSSGRLAVYEAARFYEGEVQQDIVRELLSAASNPGELLNGCSSPMGNEELWWQLFDVALLSSRAGYPGVGLAILRNKGWLLPAVTDRAAIHAAAQTVVAEIGLRDFAFDEGGDHSNGDLVPLGDSTTYTDDLVCDFASLFRYCKQQGIQVDRRFHYLMDRFD
ncbi:hypothetical protein GP486_005575 [Trichoglossum hirsutum]|uniref:Uncharacterized protein n=1 Tax=Trichoglossum hirsutum TaxID=265104 RepID=A0A9P8L8Y2_9PEZI|nr:hypothetical protein GP486_005575 [Trichoglossum hirsutum]